MNRLTAVVVLALVSASFVAKAEELKLPPEVTPQLRAACEGDVRRLCLGPSPTVAKVKSCVSLEILPARQEVPDRARFRGLLALRLTTARGQAAFAFAGRAVSAR